MANWYDNVPAPMDADGREVPLDMRELVCEGAVRNVCSFEHYPSSGQWTVKLVDVPLNVNVRDCTLPDSLELLEKDARKDACEYFCRGDGSICNKCQSCPAYGDDCGPAMAQDVVRRAKALAGVDDGE